VEKTNISSEKSTKLNRATDMFTIVEWDLNSGHFYSSDSYQKYAMSQVDENHLLKNFVAKSGVHPADLRMMCDLFEKATHNDIAEERILRFKMTDGSYSWTCVSVKFVLNENKAPRSFILILVGVNDKVFNETIPEKTYMSLQVKNNDTPLGIAFYEFDENPTSIHNDGYVLKNQDALSGEEADNRTNNSRSVSGFNSNRFFQRNPLELYELFRAGQTIEAQIQLKGKENSWEWLNFVGKALYEQGECPLCYIMLAESTQQLDKKMLCESWDERFQSKRRSPDSITFNYIPDMDTLVYSSFSDGAFQNNIVEGFLRNLPQSTSIHPDWVESFAEIVRNSQTVCNNTFDFLSDFDGKGYQWWRTRYISVVDISGHIRKIIGIADNINTSRKKSAIFNDSSDIELVFKQFFFSGALIALKYNITTGKRFFSDSDIFPPKIPDNIAITEFLQLLSDLVHPADYDGIKSHLDIEMIKQNLKTTNKKISFDCRARSISGKFDGYHWVGVNYMNISEAYHMRQAIIFIYIVDIDEKKKSQLRLMDQAKQDALTGLMNRKGFFEFFAEYILRASIEVDKNLRTAAFVLINIDNMKQINNNYGHIFGDRLIKKMAITLRAIHKESAARLYADKFALCLYDFSEQAILEEKIRIIVNALTQKINEDITLTVSIGISIYPTDAKLINDLYDKADKALCKVVKKGGHQCMFYSPELETTEPDDMVDINSGDLSSNQKQRVYIRTFGYFELFVDEQAVPIKLSKAKELLALLVDRRGGFMSASEAISFLWEDEPADMITKSRYRKVAMRLKNILSEYGIEDIIENSNGLRRIVPEKVSCDYYDYLSGHPESEHPFMGAYMSNYSWGESTLSMLEQMNIKPD